MIIKCEKKDLEETLSYIGEDYRYCLYLFLDLKKYGLDSNVIEVFHQIDNNEIKSVLLKYYSCLHIYSKNNDFNADEVVSFFEEKKFSIIYCLTTTAQVVYRSFSKALKDKSTVTNGWVANIQGIDRPPQGRAVLAEKRDFEQITKLIYAEEIGKSYNFKDLSEQLKKRSEEGYARNIVIKDDTKIIAHACTNAELENIAVVAELIVRKEYRNKGYATEIWRDICNRLLNENKEVYSIYYSEESRQLHKKVGFKEVCEWSKIVVDQS